MTPKYADRRVGTWSGFDRLVFRGTLRRLSFVEGRRVSLSQRQVRLKECGAHVQAVPERVKAAGRAAAHTAQVPVQDLAAAPVSQAEVARPIARDRGIPHGPVGLRPGGEPFVGADLSGNAAPQRREWGRRSRKGRPDSGSECPPEGGFLNGRLRTGFPFEVPTGRNGREGRARPWDAAGLPDARPDPGFPPRRGRCPGARPPRAAAAARERGISRDRLIALWALSLPRTAEGEGGIQPVFRSEFRTPSDCRQTGGAFLSPWEPALTPQPSLPKAGRGGADNRPDSVSPRPVVGRGGWGVRAKTK